MPDLDEMLRESLGRLAEPGDTAGVAEAVAAKAAAVSAAGGAAGAGGAGLLGWIPVGIIVAAAAGVGVTLGTTADASGGSTGAYAPMMISPSGGIPAASCPGGTAVTELDGGARVLAIARSEDGAFVAVRDPRVLSRTVWVQADLATPDSGTDPSTLPVESCAVASDAPSAEPSPSVTPSASAEPEPSETTEPEETTKPQPKPTKTPKPKPTETEEPEPGDTKKPAIAAGSWTPGTIWSITEVCGFVDQASINVTATDEVGVTSVTASANFGASQLTQLSHQGDTWTFRYRGTYEEGPEVPVKVTFTARDEAGNTRSASATLTLKSADSCLE